MEEELAAERGAAAAAGREHAFLEGRWEEAAAAHAAAHTSWGLQLQEVRC